MNMSEFNNIPVTNTEINEDSVQVKLFTSTTISDDGFWENLNHEINLMIQSLAKDYIWHRDEFKMCLPILYNNYDDNPMHLTSTVCFGDNIEDEWFIVYLLMEISKRHKDLIIQVIDNDGDFLLIEAAHYLPLWATPENTENRVFIFDSKVHLIPPSLIDLENKVNLKNSLYCLTNCSEQTKVSTEIQEAIQTRIGQYPLKMEENFHTAIVKLPVDVATVLTLQPSLIAPIVTTYCNHDMIDAKTCKNLNFTDYIYTEVKFTKCLYAMLMHSKLIRSVKHNLLIEDHKRDVLGIKLTCGFQMIMNILNKDVFSTKEYIQFEKNLKHIGYFKENIEGSLQYNNLLNKARQYFMDIECPINTYVSNKISNLMARNDFLSCKETLKQKCVENLKEDNDDWLSIDPNQLNDLLNNRYGDQIQFKKDDVETAETITTKLTDFLKQASDFEGIDTSKTNTENDSIDFDADQFVDCLEKMMRVLSSGTNDDLLHDSDMENDMSDDVDSDNELDKELNEKLNSFKENKSNKKVLFNLTQSIKEEGPSGPSSNLLKSIGINKVDLLDSDDD